MSSDSPNGTSRNGTSRNGAGTSGALRSSAATLAGSERLDVARPDVPRTATPADVHWKLLYERSSVDQFLADTDADCARLQSEIEVARAQRDAARQVVAARELEAQAELGALVFRYERDTRQLEAAHEQVITTIREAAEVEAARVRDAAEREVTALRGMTVTLAPLVTRRGAQAQPFDRMESAPAADGMGQADAG